MWTIGVIAVITTVTGAADFELPLTFRPVAAPGRSPVVSNGVPLLAGQARDTDELHVVGPDGKEVPAQFRVLARWWRKDNSIRWVLVSFLRSENEPEKAVYKLVGEAPGKARPGTGMKLTEDAEAIRVNTGPAEFEISKTRFNLLNRVVVGDQTVVHPDPKSGSAVEDPEGRKYYSALGTESVRVLEKGPVMVRILAQGRH
ncbi:MAG: RIFT barrel domain-containing protein, partial [Planctomycetota bacterium]